MKFLFSNLAWLDKAEELAQEMDADGLVILSHPQLRLSNPNAIFSDYAEAMESLAKANPDLEILHFYGDSHNMSSEQPFSADNAPPELPRNYTLDNFTSIQTYGFPDNGWLYVQVDPKNPRLFTWGIGGVVNE